MYIQLAGTPFVDILGKDYPVLANQEAIMLKIYVGCGLTQAPPEFRSEVDLLKNDLRKYCEVFDFMGMFDGTPLNVYQRDIHECVANCDAFIAISDFPSTGLGYELAVVVEKHSKPTLCLALENSKISRLIIGIAQPNYRFARYQGMEDRFALCLAFIREVEHAHV